MGASTSEYRNHSRCGVECGDHWRTQESVEELASPMTRAYFRTRNNISIMRTSFVQGTVKVRRYGISEGKNAKSSIWASIMR